MSRIRNTVREPSFFYNMQVTLLRTPPPDSGSFFTYPELGVHNFFEYSRSGLLTIVEPIGIQNKRLKKIILFNFVFSLIVFCCCSGYGVFRQRQTKKRGARATIRNRMKETGE